MYFYGTVTSRCPSPNPVVGSYGIHHERKVRRSDKSQNAVTVCRNRIQPVMVFRRFVRCLDQCVSYEVLCCMQPEGIGHLVNLEELRLDSNNLAELPPVCLLTSYILPINE